jgi:hypothetical protein
MIKNVHFLVRERRISFPCLVVGRDEGNESVECVVAMSFEI